MSALSAIGTATKASGAVGSVVKVTVTIENKGPASSPDTKVTVTAPTGTELVDMPTNCEFTTPGKAGTCEGLEPAVDARRDGVHERPVEVEDHALRHDAAQPGCREMTGELGNSGRGRTIGAELLATYRGGPWFGWLSYSLSKSTRVDRPGEEERLFTYDQPHSMNAAASWQSKNKRWQLGGRFQLYSGLPYTPATGSIFDSDRNFYIPLYAPPNSERAPMHHQLDIRVDYNWKWGPTALTFTARTCASSPAMRSTDAGAAAGIGVIAWWLGRRATRA